MSSNCNRKATLEPCVPSLSLFCVCSSLLMVLPAGKQKGTDSTSWHLIVVVFFSIYFHLCHLCVFYLYVLCVPHAFLVNVEARRGSQSPGPGVIFLSRIWMLEIEPELSGSSIYPPSHLSRPPLECSWEWLWLIYNTSILSLTQLMVLSVGVT